MAPRWGLLERAVMIDRTSSLFCLLVISLLSTGCWDTWEASAPGERQSPVSFDNDDDDDGSDDDDDNGSDDDDDGPDDDDDDDTSGDDDDDDTSGDDDDDDDDTSGDDDDDTSGDDDDDDTSGDDDDDDTSGDDDDDDTYADDDDTWQGDDDDTNPDDDDTNPDDDDDDTSVDDDDTNPDDDDDDTSSGDDDTSLDDDDSTPWVCTDPTWGDIDGDGLLNDADPDTDGDGEENPLDEDDDNDGLLDFDELTTDPLFANTDCDSCSDLQELLCGSDPTDPFSVCDGVCLQIPEGLSSEVTVSYDTQVQQGDVLFLLDETGSMQGTLDDVKNSFGQIASEAALLIPDLSFGVASFDDYNFGTMGNGNDRPYHPGQQQTTDLGAVQSALDGLYASGGWDWPESTIEALYQAATGAGYDQDCDGAFDTGTDVRPFVANVTDAFGGTVQGTYDSGTPGGGDLGGNGFREGAVPIFVYATDATIRNPAGGEGPGGCPFDAATPHLIDALGSINGRTIGIAAATGDPVSVMQDIAFATDSWLDYDGNGSPSSNEWMVWNSTSYTVVDQVLEGIEDFVSAITYDLTMETDDPDGVIVAVDPTVYNDVPALNTVEFTLTLQPTPAEAATIFSDRVYVVPTTLYGDGEVVLWQGDLSFLISVGP